MREDLLSLDINDLISLSNYGLVQRAAKEFHQIPYQVNETVEGKITFNWSDNAICTLSPGASLNHTMCSCAATSICRHIIRSILAYQNENGILQNKYPKSNIPQSSLNWDPGEIQDEQISNYFSNKQLKNLENQFERNQIIELFRGSKPSAYFHNSSTMVRFLIQNDISYSHCNCNHPSPCPHAVMAIWAFRKLQTTKNHGYIFPRTTLNNVQYELFAEINLVLCDIIISGIANTSKNNLEKIQKLIIKCNKHKVIWFETILNDIATEIDKYLNRDPHFSQHTIAELIGELLIRIEIITSTSHNLPRQLISGSYHTEIRNLEKTIFIGLGSRISLNKYNYAITAYLLEKSTGNIVAIEKKISPKSINNFGEFGQLHALQDISFYSLGKSSLLLDGGKITADKKLIPGRAKTITYPQTIEWENNITSLFSRHFSDIVQRKRKSPPSYLTQRHISNDIYIMKISSILDWHFSHTEQIIQATLTDQNTEKATLFFPYHPDNHSGCNTLLHYLSSRIKPLFIAGKISVSHQGLIIEPISIVFDRDGKRILIQPWIEVETHQLQNPIPNSFIQQPPKNNVQPIDNIQFYINTILDMLGYLIIIGAKRLNNQSNKLIKKAILQGEQFGFHNMITPLEYLSMEITKAEQSSQTIPEYNQITAIIKDILILYRMAKDESIRGIQGN